MNVRYADGSEVIMDFVFPTLDNVRRAIVDGGASNGRELLEEAGLSADEAAAEIESLLGRPDS